MKKWLPVILKGLMILILVNVVAQYLYTRIDLTENQRYTLSRPALSSVAPFENPVIVDVLLEGNLSPEFVKLKTEVRQILQEFALANNNIKYNFVDPFEGADQPEGIVADLQRMGLTPTQLTIEENSKVSQDILFPWALVNHNNKTVKVNLLKNKLGASQMELVNNSVQQLEYTFADAFTKVALTDKKRIAVIKGNGEMDDLRLANLLTELREYYNIGAITLDSVTPNPQGTLDQLKQFDLALIAKPTEAFSDSEKYVMDQYVVNGGKSIWLIDQVAMEIDSLYNEKGTAMAFPRDLNLKDFFFKQGVRINPVLVNDLYFTQIVLASGEDNNSQYNPAPWYYHPMALSRNDHPINTAIEAVRLQFVSAMDTLPNGNKKHILLQSSPLSKIEGTPREIRLESINTAPNKDTYTNGNHAVAVLIEGSFHSSFENRIKPLKLQGTLEKGPENKMIVIADGDVAKNQLRNGRPLELGYDKWTNNFYGNKEFMINCVNYLLDDNGLINIRSKKVTIPFLDTKKVEAQKGKWQLINIGVPLALILIIGFVFNYLRKLKYGR